MSSFARARRLPSLIVLLAVASVAALAEAGSAAAESCTYDPATHVVTASITPGSAATVRVVGTEIWFGFSPAACGGATTTNTDTIAIAGAPGSVEHLVFDHAGGPLAPGVTPEGANLRDRARRRRSATATTASSSPAPPATTASSPLQRPPLQRWRRRRRHLLAGAATSSSSTGSAATTARRARLRALLHRA